MEKRTKGKKGEQVKLIDVVRTNSTVLVMNIIITCIVGQLGLFGLGISINYLSKLFDLVVAIYSCAYSCFYYLLLTYKLKSIR